MENLKKIKDEAINLMNKKEIEFNNLIEKVKDKDQKSILIDAMNRAKKNEITISEVSNLMKKWA